MRKLIIGLPIIFIIPALCFASVEGDLEVDLLKGDYNKVISSAQNSISNGSASSEIYYLAGLAYLKKKDYAQARYNLDSAIKKAKDKKIKNKATLALADTYFLEKKFEDALPLYESLLKQNHNSGLVSLLLLRASQCNIKAGKWEEGNLYLNKLRSEYPNSLEALMSEPLSSTDEFFCVQAGSFTREENARDFALCLKQKGYDAYVSGVKVEDKVLYRVRVGECETRAQAEGLKEGLDALGYDTKIYP